jgi:hypothetical protein
MVHSYCQQTVTLFTYFVENEEILAKQRWACSSNSNIPRTPSTEINTTLEAQERENPCAVTLTASGITRETPLNSAGQEASQKELPTSILNNPFFSVLSLQEDEKRAAKNHYLLVEVSD